MVKNLSFSCLILLLLLACNRNENETGKLKTAEDSFFPLEVGNYWKINDQNYTEIRDTVRIGGKSFYELYSIVGGDATSTVYYRLDEENNLIEGYPENPSEHYLHAKFNADVGEVFYTLNDKTVNDYQVTVKSKSDSSIVFEFDMVYHPNLKGQKHLVEYIRGIGRKDIWKEIRINGIIHRFQ
jgi:hypothetical protein